MTVRLTVNSETFADVAEAIRRDVTLVWQREGLRLEWAESTGPPTWNGIDVWVVIQHAPASFSDRAAVGAVLFSNSDPHPVVRISVDAAIDWVRRGWSRRHGLPDLHADQILLDDIRADVELTMAYAVAHEIGHVVTRSRDHARTGLMQAHLRSLFEMSRGPRAIRLDHHSRQRLMQRQADASRCAQP